MSVSEASISSHISLIQLKKQFPFEIDDELKQELCFAETLIISCTHQERVEEVPGENEKEASSMWTCTPSTESKASATKVVEAFEIKDYVPEPEPEEEPEEDNDFHFYFFPDCAKPPAPQHSQQSIIMENGLPKVNPAAKDPTYCTCGKNKKGECECFIKVICKCGAKKIDDCICSKLENICICNELEPATVCTCDKNNKVCTCFPELPRPICVCDTVEKPCICKTFPNPVCACKHKPTFGKSSVGSFEGGLLEGEVLFARGETEYPGEYPGEGEFEEHTAVDNNRDFEKLEPCVCQAPEPKPRCFCRKEGRECICNESCVCGIMKSCVCEPTSSTDVLCKSSSESSKLVCVCAEPKICTCEAEGIECQCFPNDKYCSCGDPDNCKCKKPCDCTDPCICDTIPPVERTECICYDKVKQIKAGLVCTCVCKDKDATKLKKIRAGKQGYRWCHDVDPYHSFFDYAYGLHDKIDTKEQENEKFKILGLFDEKDGVCPVHGVKTYKFEKKVGPPSLDCCSSVGGISISVDVLGEDGTKFLVQIVSHSAKEGAKTGSKLVSIVDLNLHTMEENRVEHISKKDIIKERKSYMAICDNGYYNKVTKYCGERKVVKRFYHTFEQARNFLLEGANIVLMRYFGLRRYRGVVNTVTVMMDGTICESVYNSLGTSQAVVNGQPLYVVKVERHIIYPNGKILQSLTVLSLKGYTISHEWSENSYVLHINPLLRVHPDRDEIEQHAPLREKWREDLQLMSDFLDYKTTRTAEGARYVAENGMLTSTVRDYLQAILMLKPHDVVHFTRHYFDSALSAMDLPRDEYFDPCPKHVRYYYFEE